MKKKLLALLLTLCMAAGVVACGAKEQSETTPAQTETAETEQEVAKEEPKGEPKELLLIMYGEMTERREKFFGNEFHDKVLEELNLDVTVEFLPWGALTGDVTNRLIAGEKFMFMYGLSGNDLAQRGLVSEISEEDIATYLPNHTKMRGDNGYEFAKYDGKIYAVPMGNKPYSANNKGVSVRNDILNEVGWDYSDITSFEKLEEAAADVLEANPDIRILVKPGHLALGLDSALSDDVTYTDINNIVMTYLTDDDDKVYSYLESDEFKDWVKIAEDWRAKGFILDDHISDPSAGPNDWSQGNCLIYSGVVGNMVEPGVKKSMGEGADIEVCVLGDLEKYPRFIAQDYDWAMGVSAAAQEDVPDYLKLIDWIYASQENYEFCIYGVEGTDWERAEDGSINALISEKMFDDWFLQAFCYHTYDASIDDTTIEIYEHWDDNATKSKMAGFVFDATPVAAEKAQLDAIWTEYWYPMYQGFLSFDENYESVLKKAKDAGLDKVVAEYQKQYSEFYANNK